MRLMLPRTPEASFSNNLISRPRKASRAATLRVTMTNWLTLLAGNCWSRPR